MTEELDLDAEANQEHVPGSYTYERAGGDGTFNLIAIISPEGREIACLSYWDEPDTDEARRVEEAARTICEHLSRWLRD
jgi:hypothetical protein